MKKSIPILTLIFAFLFAVTGSCYAESDLAKKFKEALNKNRLYEMTSIVEKNLKTVPEEIKALTDGAFTPQKTAQERDSDLNAAEFMANEYKNATGDFNPLKDVKARIFNSKLSGPVVSRAVKGVHVVEAVSTDKAKNIFMADNIVIKRGETVKWVNHDNTAHLLASMPVIGMTGLFSPDIEPGQSWEHTFDKPGDYYYICFIHKVMYGKITVE